MNNADPPVVKPIKSKKADCFTTQKVITLSITHNSTCKASDLRGAVGRHYKHSSWPGLSCGLAPALVKIISALLPGEAVGCWTTVSYGCMGKNASTLDRPAVSREQATQDLEDFQGFPEKAKNLRVVVIDEDTGRELMNEKVSN